MASRKQPSRLPNYETVALVLQGGGALGAYQAGVYEGLHEAGIRPNWVSGISIGSINAAIIAGSPEEERVARLRGFWEAICRPTGFAGLPWGETLAGMFDGMPFGFGSPVVTGQLAAFRALTQGQPGFFTPRVPSPYLLRDSGAASTSFYDTSPLAATLREYVDFELLNRGTVRASFGAVNVRTGNFAYFDSTRQPLGPEHVMASGALPPGFPAVEVDGQSYWDGGIVSNTPLAEVLRVHPMPDTLAFQVDLWPARGELPTSMDEVAQRQKDIQYSSRTRLVTDNYRKILQLRRGLQTLLERLPAGQRNSPDLADLRAQACTPLVNVVNLIYQAKHYERESKDYEFSTEAMREHWQFGLADIRRTLAQPRVLDKPSVDQSFITHDVHRSAPDSR
ncbi:bifunctional protein include phospholipase and oxidoreductase [Bordetella ansorpii]|uniref:Bifunctional protein include phospholipase and oxidoreductase n=1 Tax=Bordetella ansorpii TaxID=288768 RepID=A0A157RJ88_9BORD|nr:patatin-like phospholipase family protein [Bordetella ansorpii]SAI58052.1 bifunctional protein include phospholipase and oxidoreductase [Bordetella ansorpii]